MTAFGDSGRNYKLNRTEKAEVLLETPKGILRRPDGTHANFGTSGNPQIPEMPVLFAVEEEVKKLSTHWSWWDAPGNRWITNRNTSHRQYTSVQHLPQRGRIPGE